MLKLGYLGPEGTNSQEAAEKWSQNQYELVPLWPISVLFDALLKQKIARVIAPIENSLAGEVGETVDFLIKYTRNGGPIGITGELLLPIKHFLWSKPGSKRSDIKKVISHPQALAQCYGFLKDWGGETSEVASTAQAAKIVAESEDNTLAAIASPEVKARYPLMLLAEDIGDSKDNVTRFVFLGGPQPTPTDPKEGTDKTTIFFVTEDQAGALYHALGAFYYQGDKGINLSKISSHTSKRRLGDYIFWVEAIGHRENANLKDAISQLRERFTKELWIAGSYPCAKQEI